MPRVRSFGDGLYDIATRARDPEFHAGLVASALAKVENLRPAPVLTSFPLRAPPAPQVELIAIELFDWLQNVQAQIELRLIFRWSCAVVARTRSVLPLNMRRGLAAFLALCIKHFGQPRAPSVVGQPSEGRDVRAFFCENLVSLVGKN